MIRNKGKKCSIYGCERQAFCKGYCSKHYQQIKFHGEVKKESAVVIPEFCKNLSCGKKVFAKGLCQTCYIKSRQHEVLDGLQ